MATITTLANNPATSVTHASAASNVKLPYLAEVVIDFSEAVTAKLPTALAASDVIEAILVPANTVILGCGAQVITVADSTTLTMDIGITGGDVDEWVDGLDGKATAGTYSTDLEVTPSWTTIGTTADTIDVLFATLTGTLTTGKVRVYAWLLDVSARKAPGLVALGS